MLDGGGILRLKESLRRSTPVICAISSSAVCSAPMRSNWFGLHLEGIGKAGFTLNSNSDSTMQFRPAASWKDLTASLSKCYFCTILVCALYAVVFASQVTLEGLGSSYGVMNFNSGIDRAMYWISQVVMNLYLRMTALPVDIAWKGTQCIFTSRFERMLPR